MMVHFPKDVRNRLCLSHQTIEGISTTQNHREYVVFLHRILPYSRSSYIMNTGKLFKKYTETIFNRILSKYGRIRCKKNPVFSRIRTEYSWIQFLYCFWVFSRIHCTRTPWIRENTVQKTPVFTVILCSAEQ